MEPCRFCPESFPTTKARDLHEGYLCTKPSPKPKSHHRSAPSAAATPSPTPTSTDAANLAPPSSSPSAKAARPDPATPPDHASPTPGRPTSAPPTGAASETPKQTDLDVALQQRNEAQRRVRQLEDDLSKAHKDLAEARTATPLQREKHAGGSGLGSKHSIVALESRLYAVLKLSVRRGLLPQERLANYEAHGILPKRQDLGKRDHLRAIGLLMDALDPEDLQRQLATLKPIPAQPLETTEP